MYKLDSTIIKAKEKEHRVYITSDKHIVVRLDGRGFSKFTKQFSKPFDRHFSNAMIAATEEVSKKFGALVSYTQSDEITVVIAGGKEHDFAGRTDKLLSLMAATVSVKFYSELTKYYDIGSQIPTFDARIMSFHVLEDALKTIVNRMIDCRKNSIGMFSDYHFGHSKNMNKNTDHKLVMLHKEGHFWPELDAHFKYGSIVYKVHYEVSFDDIDIPLKYKTNNTVLRSRYVCESFDNFDSYVDILVDLAGI